MPVNGTVEATPFFELNGVGFSSRPGRASLGAAIAFATFSFLAASSEHSLPPYLSLRLSFSTASFRMPILVVANGLLITERLRFPKKEWNEPRCKLGRLKVSSGGNPSPHQ